MRNLALFNLALDSKLRSCDLLNLHVRDVCHGNSVSKRAMVMQQKTHQPVQFEITKQTRESIAKLIKTEGLSTSDYLFHSRIRGTDKLSTGTQRNSVG